MNDLNEITNTPEIKIEEKEKNEINEEEKEFKRSRNFMCCVFFVLLFVSVLNVACFVYITKKRIALLEEQIYIMQYEHQYANNILYND